MAHVVTALTVVSLAAIFILNIYFLLRYLIVADSLREILNCSSGDRKKRSLEYPPPVPLNGTRIGSPPFASPLGE